MSNLFKGKYRYTADLLALENNTSNPIQGRQIASPLQLQAWQEGLASYPDQTFAAFLLRGIANGFRIGVPSSFTNTPVHRNLRSAQEHPEIIQEYLDREEALGRIQRIEVTGADRFQVSPCGVIPKKSRPDKWRLIIDLSSPRGRSVNDAIDEHLSSINYTSIDDTVNFIQVMGRGTLLAKLDLKEAYRAVPVHPADQGLLAVQWKGVTFIDRALPFGLRSAPKLFSALTDGLMWILFKKGVRFALHYLDDFLLLGPPQSDICNRALLTTLSTCDLVGLPVAPDKTEGPAPCLTFLGIEIDTLANQLRLPQDKLIRLKLAISDWMRGGRRDAPKRSGTKRSLLSLIGLHNHAAKVVRPGRAFLRSLIDCSKKAQALDHHVHLNALARTDLMWWGAFLEFWNGSAIIPPSLPTLFVTSDASGGWGCAAIFQRQWFQLQWPNHRANSSIAVKELAPIVIALGIWGRQWAGHKVCALCDNISVVCAINKKVARDPALSRLLRPLCLLCALLDICLVARHLPGAQNASADALSRNKLDLFFSINPQASPDPATLTQPLLELVLDLSLQGASKRWTALLTSILANVSPHPHALCTPQQVGGTPPSATNLA